MFEAQLLIQGSTVFSPWFPRGGDNVTATLEVVEISSATLKVELFTKNSEDAGNGSNADSAGTPISISATATGRTSATWSQPTTSTVSIKEMVRYKFTVTGTGTNWVLFRMLPPVWFDSVEA